MEKNNSTASPFIRFPRSMPDWGSYMGTSLQTFYAAAAHRMLLYALTFILSGLTAFAALWIYDIGYGLYLYNDIPLTFKGMYSWHTAANFGISLILVDIAATLVFRLLGKSGPPTVGIAWIVFSVAFCIGFVVQRTLVYQWVDLYYPELILRHETYPAERPDALPTFLFMLPLLLVIGYFLIRFMLSVQARSEELLRVRIDTILEERSHPSTGLPPAQREIPAGDDFPDLPLDAGVAPIRSTQIGHITAEDHYLRLHYRLGEIGRQTLIRMSMKELSSRLPADCFIRIHRSHMVNLQWVSGVKRTGRDVKLTLKHSDAELPVSRYRLPQLLPVLDQYLKRPKAV